MQKVITKPKISLWWEIKKTPRDILELWDKVRGMWKHKKIDPLQYLKKTRQQWEQRTP